MANIINPGNHSSQSLNPCNDKGPLFSPLNTDPISPICKDHEPSLNDVSGSDLSWLEERCNEKEGYGKSGNCDPMQAGKIVDDLENPQRNVHYRYSKAIRGAAEGMLDLFRGLVVIDEQGRPHPVPIIYGTQEDAVGAILQDNVRKDNSLVVDRIKLPMLALHSSNIQMDQTKYAYHRAVDYLRYRRDDGKPGFTIEENGRDRGTVFGVARGIPVNISYTLYAWTSHVEDMDQIVEQVMTKFSPVAYIRVRGVSWEIIATMDSIANNIDFEPGDKKSRVIKYQFNITVATYIPQPLRREKAVLKTKIGVVDGTDLAQASELLMKLEQAVEELE